jgi:hypothetical protein
MSAPRRPYSTANLQITIKQAATLMNVSERSVYMARKVGRNRPDLEPEIMAGRMSLHHAYQLSTNNRTKPTKLAKLLALWRSASDEDRKKFLILIGTAGRNLREAAK